MRQDIDYIDYDSDSIVNEIDFLTPRCLDGFFKIRLTNSLTLYYRFESHFIFCYIVRSFDSQGAHAPRSLPILFYWHESMLDAWEKIEYNDDSD